MDWKICLAAFWTIFLAELGDKTQLANVSLAARARSPLAVCIGSIMAFSLVTIITVTLGGMLAKFIKPEYVRYAAGGVFVIAGVLMLAGKL